MDTWARLKRSLNGAPGSQHHIGAVGPCGACCEHMDGWLLDKWMSQHQSEGKLSVLPDRK